jgi:hypothetical protein
MPKVKIKRTPRMSDFEFRRLELGFAPCDHCSESGACVMNCGPAVVMVDAVIAAAVEARQAVQGRKKATDAEKALMLAGMDAFLKKLAGLEACCQSLEAWVAREFERREAEKAGAALERGEAGAEMPGPAGAGP